jgi:carbon-monoxide dehydrogenase small subunit
MKTGIDLTINGDAVHLEVEPHRTLLDVLRNDLGLTGAKDGCGTGDCGACTVLLDGEPINSCLALPATLAGRSITTIEGLARDPLGKRLQTALVEHGAVQCGYCTPGLLLAAKSLLTADPSPDGAAIRRGISGNLCRCTGYAKVVAAIRSVAADAPTDSLAASEGGAR